MENGVRAVWRNPYRGFVHPAPRMAALLEERGFALRLRRETLKWCADLYARTTTSI